jgi:hypothetical protein
MRPRKTPRPVHRSPQARPQATRPPRRQGDARVTWNKVNCHGNSFHRARGRRRHCRAAATASSVVSTAGVWRAESPDDRAPAREGDPGPAMSVLDLSARADAVSSLWPSRSTARRRPCGSRLGRRVACPVDIDAALVRWQIRGHHLSNPLYNRQNYVLAASHGRWHDRGRHRPRRPTRPLTPALRRV